MGLDDKVYSYGNIIDYNGVSLGFKYPGNNVINYYFHTNGVMWYGFGSDNVSNSNGVSFSFNTK